MGRKGRIQKQPPRTLAERPSYILGSLLITLVLLSVCVASFLLIIAYRDLDIGLADAEADTGDYFVLIVNDAPIPPAFPSP